MLSNVSQPLSLPLQKGILKFKHEVQIKLRVEEVFFIVLNCHLLIQGHILGDVVLSDPSVQRC